MQEMPLYQCHKQVRGLKIAEVQTPHVNAWIPEGSRTLVFEKSEYEPLTVAPDFVAKHNPQPGTYYVVYDDNYASISPADAFESGYTLIEETPAPAEKATVPQTDTPTDVINPPTTEPLPTNPEEPITAAELDPTATKAENTTPQDEPVQS